VVNHSEIRSRAASLTALCLFICTLHTNEIPRTDPLVQVDNVRVVDLDIGASKSDICAIRVITISERAETAYREIMNIPRRALTGMRIPPSPPGSHLSY
jgi:hypothetical protein